jgi:hypothetical protein
MRKSPTNNDWFAVLPATGHRARVLHLLKRHPFPVVAWFAVYRSSDREKFRRSDAFHV